MIYEAGGVMSDTAHTTADELTTEQVWKLIEPKIREYWAIAKIVCWILVTVIGVVVAFIFGTITSLLSIDAVKDAVVTSVVKVDKIFDDNGKAFLNEEIDKYFRSEKPTFVFDAVSNAPLKLKAMDVFNKRFSDNLKSTVNNIVAAYSFSTTFSLSDAKRDHNLRFYKPNGSTAEIDCNAVYLQGARKNVNITLNNFSDQLAVVPSPSSNQGRGHVSLAKDNVQYFQDKSKVNDYQSMTFVVDADKPFRGSISLDCTVTVVGSARLAQDH